MSNREGDPGVTRGAQETRPVLVIQHVPWEKPAIIGEVLDERMIHWRSTIVLDSTEPGILPALDSLGGVVILGGPMGAQDVADHPGLAFEADLVRRAVADDVPVLGVCLGHQIIATALGAELHSGAAAEFGIGDVEVLSDGSVLGRGGERRPVLHWHGDVVGVPDGAELLARSAQTPNQAFQLGTSVLAMQFHIETDRRMLAAWLEVPEMAADLDLSTRDRIEGEFTRAESSMRSMAERAFRRFADAVVLRG